MLRRILSMTGTVVLLLSSQVAGAFSVGEALNYALLTSPGVNNVQMSNSTVNGNWGVTDPFGGVNLSSGTLNGNLDFQGTAPGGVGSATITGSINSNVAAVGDAWNTVSALSTTLGATAGTALNINGGGQTIFASAGNLVGDDRVFTVNSFDVDDGITISGSATDYVVFNFDNGNSNVDLKGDINLTGGITADRVLFNFTGTGGELKGGGNSVVNGLFLFPDLKLNINSAEVNGLLAGGDSSDFQFVSGMTITAVPIPAAVWLFASGLGLLGWIRRRRT